MDDFRIFHRTMSDEEIEKVYTYIENQLEELDLEPSPEQKMYHQEQARKDMERHKSTIRWIASLCAVTLIVCGLLFVALFGRSEGVIQGFGLIASGVLLFWFILMSL